jgi:hypothetical protein
MEFDSFLPQEKTGAGNHLRVNQPESLKAVTGYVAYRQ